MFCDVASAYRSCAHNTAAADIHLTVSSKHDETAQLCMHFFAFGSSERLHIHN